MKIQKQINIELTRKGFPQTIDLVQYDTGIQLIFCIKDFTIPEGTTAALYAQKPSGKFVYQETEITISGNTVTVDLENQAITEYGKIPYQISLENGSDSITTFAGILDVERRLKDAAAEESKTVVSSFEALTAEQIAEIKAATQTQIGVLQGESQKQQNEIIEIGKVVNASIPEDYTALDAEVKALAAYVGSLGLYIDEDGDVCQKEE